MPDERRRHQLYLELRGLLTRDSADLLMSYLPPVGWADAPTKADLGALCREIDALRAELRAVIATR